MTEFEYAIEDHKIMEHSIYAAYGAPTLEVQLEHAENMRKCAIVLEFRASQQIGKLKRAIEASKSLGD